MTPSVEITSCYIGPELTAEQFVPEHFFLYLAKGTITGYDGHKKYAMRAGDSCIVRKNRLARYSKEKENDTFEKVVVVFDESFLTYFQQKYKVNASSAPPESAFLPLAKNELVPNYVRSLMPYYKGMGQLDKTFSNLKREELMLVLLNIRPDLASVFFDFGIPQKMDLEAFMNAHFRFNVSISRFAYLTGRSVSTFKRDFKKIFSETPGRWLLRRRLEEAYFLIAKKKKKATDIYLELGFEDLSHFSFAFRKQFGSSPTEVLARSFG